MIPDALSDMIRDNRKRVGMTQTELGTQVSKSRQWVAQLEGANFGGRPFQVTPDELLRIATIIRVPIVDLLKVSGLPRNRWPNLSHVRSMDANIRTIDLTALTDDQADIVERLVDTLKAGNNGEGKTQ